MPMRKGATKHSELQIPNGYEFTPRLSDEYDVNEYYV